MIFKFPGLGPWEDGEAFMRFFFFNLIGMTGVHSIIFQEIKEGRQL